MQLGGFKRKILVSCLISTVLFICIFSSTYSEAHILIIGDSISDVPYTYDTAKSVASQLKQNGYSVLEFYRENATSKNIIKGMYNADALIYLGHGGYMGGHYDLNGGVATPPFALVGSDDFIWGIGDKMREGWNGNLFTAPFKPNIPVIIFACFSTGNVQSKEVANPIETIYNFSKMFTGAGANYYATCHLNSTNINVIDKFLAGSPNFKDAIDKGPEPLTKSTVYNGVTIWRNDRGVIASVDQGISAFVGDWNGKFPTAIQTTPYNDAAAEAWYNSMSGGQDTTPPTVTSTNPASESTGISINSPIVLNFSENILSGTNFAGIYIKNMISGATLSLASKTIQDNTLTIQHTNLLKYNTQYKVYIPSGGVKDAAGNGLASAYTYTFTTTSGGSSDTTPPTITSTKPTSGATGVSINSPIVLNFNENIISGANFAGIYIKNMISGSKLSIASKTINTNILTIQHTNLLKYNTQYSVYIPSGAVKDAAGNGLASAYTYTFNTNTGSSDTAPPTVISTNPASDANVVSITSPIIINFSENILAGTNYSGIYIKNTISGVKVSIASKTISGNTLTIKQTNSRKTNTKYQVYIPSNAVKDSAGNSLATSYTYNFKTA